MGQVHLGHEPASGCLTHEGSHVANQAEQAAFRRVRTTFTAAGREKEASAAGRWRRRRR